MIGSDASGKSTGSRSYLEVYRWVAMQTWEMRSHRLQSGSEQCHWCHTISRHNQHSILRHSMRHVACAHPWHMPEHETCTAVHTYTLGSVYFPQCKTRRAYTCTEGRQQNTRCAKVTPWRYLALACAAGVARPGGRLAKRDAGFGPEVVWMGGTSSPRRLAADNTKHPQTPWGYGCRVAVACACACIAPTVMCMHVNMMHVVREFQFA